MIDAGQYFTINRARQYGKTTTLRKLKTFLAKEYIVVNLDFQRLGYASFETEQMFVEAFSNELLMSVDVLPEKISLELEKFTLDDLKKCTFQKLFQVLSKWCKFSEKPIVLIIDEVDSASNNQVFLDFLAQLRADYIDRDVRATFQSVILAGVYDIKNLKRKMRLDEVHKVNSPWNIASDFNVDMSFSKREIKTMLEDYEKDYQIGMDIDYISSLLFDYTSGYPFLVSRICKLMDEIVFGTEIFQTKKSVWTKAGVLEAVKLLLTEKNTLFESLEGKLVQYPRLKQIIYSILFGGQTIVYNVFDEDVNMAMMFGFIKKEKGTIQVANRIFEILLYNYFLTSTEAQTTAIFKAASECKSQFIQNGRLNMKHVMKKFVEHFDSIYGERKEVFDEEEGRRRFLLYLRPIINGVGNYYIEAQTRNARRMDIVVDYLGEQFIIELKIWHGKEYNNRGEQQLVDYLNYFHRFFQILFFALF